MKTGFDLVKGAIDTLKGLRDLIPSKSGHPSLAIQVWPSKSGHPSLAIQVWPSKSGQSDDVTKQIELAERQVALGEAQLAQALGYQLCRA
ncbi:MAG: hypothetical protein ABL908_08890, partial [Hyphomicrobium sp.]